jgi:aspartate kinase
MLVVKKFGGTSVGSSERIKKVALLIQRYKKLFPKHQLVIVVSAMAGETNRLLELAQSCSKQDNPRELDLLLATGEQASVALTSMALSELNISARGVIASQVKILTTGFHNNAQVADINTELLNELLVSSTIPVVAGFQGVNESGAITTLGRGGSDITAVALASALKADACYIYTDVDGVYTTDPRICSSAFKLKEIYHEEMLEMASLGAKVLHPRSVYFAMRYEVPLAVLSSFDDSLWTEDSFSVGDKSNADKISWIVKGKENNMEAPVVTGIALKSDESSITVKKLKGGTSDLSKIFSLLGEADIFVDLITQSELSDSIGATISFTVPDAKCIEAVELLKASLSGNLEVSFERSLSKVSVVGVGMRYHVGVASKIFSSLAKAEISVKLISSSEIKVSVLVGEADAKKAVNSLHSAFFACDASKEICYFEGLNDTANSVG